MNPPDDKLKHKPNEKHTLDEVLKSLQDLIRNEVVGVATVAPSETKIPSSPVAPTSADIGPALDTLDHFIRHELAEPAVSAAPDAAPDDQAHEEFIDIETIDPRSESRADAEPAPDVEMIELTAVEEAPGSADPTQSTLDFSPRAGFESSDQNVASSMQSVEFETPSTSADPEESAIHFDDVSTRDAPTAPISDNAIDPALHASAEPEFEAPDAAMSVATTDIPVLQDIIAPAPTESIVAPTMAVESSITRDIAIKVIAQLNMELRRAGERPLAARMIDRMQRLLHEALEKTKDN